jgi:hypothetical protein
VSIIDQIRRFFLPRSTARPRPFSRVLVQNAVIEYGYLHLDRHDGPLFLNCDIRNSRVFVGPDVPEGMLRNCVLRGCEVVFHQDGVREKALRDCLILEHDEAKSAECATEGQQP